jgi:L,D-transpeptidase YbiS
VSESLSPAVGEAGAAAAPAAEGLRSVRRGGRALLVVLVILVSFGALAAMVTGTGYRYGPLPAPGGPPLSGSTTAPGRPGSDEIRKLRAERAKLRASLAAKAPKGVYIVIDQTQNRFYLREGDRILLDARCSAGSGMTLREREGSRYWVFDTPRGAFQVRTRLVNPAWRKPDWAFIEEGKPIPEDPAERIEYGSLGEYALDFGDGNLIHGTLYERLLGRSVTHGCIRLGRDDLRRVYASCPIGTPVYIF